MTNVLKVLKSANFLVDANGQRVAVHLNMAGQGNFARLGRKARRCSNC